MSRYLFRFVRKYAILSGMTILFIFSVLSVSLSFSFAENQTPTSLNEQEVHLETEITALSIPKDNILPWGVVDGHINDPAQGYQVIIQFFKGDDQIHVAQVDVQDDGLYEYKFRVRDVNLETGEITNIFEGEYTVKIFKVVNSLQSNLDAV